MRVDYRTTSLIVATMQGKYFTLVLLCALLMLSCAAPQKSLYFSENVPNNPSVATQRIDPFKEALIQPDDIISITISSISSIAEPAAASIITNVFNNGGAFYNVVSTLGGMGGSSSGGVKGFLVDPEGYIDYPVVGKIKVSGLTIRQVKDLLVKKLNQYVKDPVAEVNIINYKITVLGEVGRPGTIIAPNHKISVLDAIAAAGDIPVTGRKDNVLIIRENEGIREFARLNLNSREVFLSPYFYLKQNDVIIVEPGTVRKQEGNDFFRFYLPAITSLMSTVLAVYGIVQLTQK